MRMYSFKSTQSIGRQVIDLIRNFKDQNNDTLPVKVVFTKPAYARLRIEWKRLRDTDLPIFSVAKRTANKELTFAGVNVEVIDGDGPLYIEG